MAHGQVGRAATTGAARTVVMHDLAIIFGVWDERLEVSLPIVPILAPRRSVDSRQT